MPNKNERRFVSLWQRIGAQGDPQPVYRDLVTRYAEPHRAYHTLAHIEHCLSLLEDVECLAGNPDAIAFALWYHDAIYDTKAKDNEEKSSELAEDVIHKAWLTPGFFIGEVRELILATKHNEIPTDPDAQVLVDIDLSILGEPEDVFDEYERQIRKEYEWVLEEVFIAGRTAILEQFLKRPRIYLTDFFFKGYESQARENLKRSLTKLSSRL